MEATSTHQFPPARDFLKEEFLDRKQNNNAYSLRGFARDLQVSPSLMSQILNGKKPITEPTAINFVEKMQWDEEQETLFLELVRLETSKSSSHRKQILKRLKPFMQMDQKICVLNIDVFKLIYKWYHQAIIELSRADDFDPDPGAIAKRLAISELEVEVAIERLIRLNFLTLQDGRLTPSADSFHIVDIPSKFIRDFHKQMLNKAWKAIESQPNSVREFSGNMMMTDPALIPEAKLRIKNFRNSLMAFLEGGNKTRLYHLGIQLFSVERAE